MNCALYLRKSRAEENSDPVETLARHKKILLEYAKKQRLTVLKIYEEGVMSGDSLMTRPQMQQLLSDISAGDYDAVLCMDIDRLGRGDMQDQGLIINTFKYSDTLIITPDKTYNLNDETDEELTEFKTFFARRELKTITRRLQRGLKQTIREGGYVANAPYGYKKAYLNKKPTLEIIEEEAYFVRLIFKMYLEGNGSQIIADELNRLGAKPRRNEKFSRNTVRYILKNPVFCGKISWDRYKHYRKGTHNNTLNKRYYNDESNWITVDGIHEPIIDEDTFNRAQEIRKSKSIPSKSKGSVKISNPFAGLIVCKNCGCKMQRRTLKGVTYLLCYTSGCCASTRFEMIEKDILTAVREFAESFEINYTKLKTNDFDLLTSQLKTAENKMQTLNKQKNTLHDLLEQGIYSIDTFKERQQLLKTQFDEVNALISKLSAQLKYTNTDQTTLYNNMITLLSLWQESSAQEKNVLIKRIIKSVEYERPSQKEDYTLKVFFNI